MYKAAPGQTAIDLRLRDEYVALVVVFVLVLCCCRQITEAVQCVGRVGVEWCDDMCAALLPCSYGQRVCTDNTLRTAVVVLGFLQPLLLIVAPGIAASYDAKYTAPQVVFIEPAWNASALEGGVLQLDAGSALVRVDVVILGLPYTILAAIALATLFHTSTSPTAEPVWDYELFEDAGFCTYDLLFAAQAYWLLAACVAVAAHTITPAVALSLALGLAACVVFFMATARAAPPSGPDQVLTVVVFAVTAAILCAFWTQYVSLARPTSVLAAVALTLVVLGLDLFHSLCHGEARALTVVLVRTCASLACTGVLAGVAAAGSHTGS